jgi:hypothetical protein
MYNLSKIRQQLFLPESKKMPDPIEYKILAGIKAELIQRGYLVKLTRNTEPGLPPGILGVNKKGTVHRHRYGHSDVYLSILPGNDEIEVDYRGMDLDGDFMVSLQDPQFIEKLVVKIEEGLDTNKAFLDGPTT